MDALVRQRADHAWLADKLAELTAREAANRRERRRRAQPEVAITEALRLTARDVFIEELVALLQPLEVEALYLLAPGRLPASPADLAAAGPSDDEASVEDACWHLADLTLARAVERAGGEVGFEVPAFVGEALAERDPGRYRAAAGAMAARRLVLGRADRAGYDQEIEALRLFVRAERWDEATALVLGLGRGGLARYLRSVAGLAGEVLRGLPAEHEQFWSVADLEAECNWQSGDTAAALRRYEQLLAQAEAAHASRADDDSAYRLAITLERVGDRHLAMGRTATARDCFDRSRSLHEQRVARRPDDLQALRALSVPYNKLGDLMRAVGNGQEAARLYQQSLDISRRLADSEPDRADYQRDVVLSLQRLGMSLLTDDPAAAFESWREALERIAPLADREPERPDLAADVAVTLFLLAPLSGQESDLLRAAQQVLERHEGRLPANGQTLLDQLRARADQQSA